MDTRAMTELVRAAVRRVDPQLAARRTASLDWMIGESVVRPRFHTWLLSSFGGLALVLAAIGIYGVIAYGVAQRRPEIGIRIALGAPRSAVMSMIVRAGMGPVAIGIAGGLVAAAAGSRLVAGLLYGITPTDGFTYAAVALVFSAAGLAAACVPALRASRVDPLTAMRAD
jgi:ABC-type antimicrobial peptide transport system permease subunit